MPRYAVAYTIDPTHLFTPLLNSKSTILKRINVKGALKTDPTYYSKYHFGSGVESLEILMVVKVYRGYRSCLKANLKHNGKDAN